MVPLVGIMPLVGRVPLPGIVPLLGVAPLLEELELEPLLKVGGETLILSPVKIFLNRKYSRIKKTWL